MIFEDSFFDAEYVDGFYIRPMVKRAWGAQLNVLEKIDEICRRHKIKYYAEFGTLLGAIRHKGFIPWDDDMDIGMHRNDYEEFIKYAADELPQGYKVLNIYSFSEYDELITRVVNSDCINVSKDFLEDNCGCPYSVGIDIFISDNIPDDPNEREAHRQLFYAVWGLAQGWNNQVYSDDEKVELLHQVEELAGSRVDINGNIANQLFILSDKIAQMYKNQRTKEVAIMGSFSKFPDKHMSAENIADTIEVPFECFRIPVPREFENVLNLRYRDYKTPSKRAKLHGYPFFWEQEIFLGESYKSQHLVIPEEFDYIQHDNNAKHTEVIYQPGRKYPTELFKGYEFEVRIENMAELIQQKLDMPIAGIRATVHFLQIMGLRKLTQIAHAIGARYVVVELDNYIDSNMLDEIIYDNVEFLRKDSLMWFLQNGYLVDESGCVQNNAYSSARSIRTAVDAYNMLCGRECFGICLNPIAVDLLDYDLGKYIKMISKNKCMCYFEVHDIVNDIIELIDESSCQCNFTFCIPEEFESLADAEKKELIKKYS